MISSCRETDRRGVTENPSSVIPRICRVTQIQLTDKMHMLDLNKENKSSSGSWCHSKCCLSVSARHFWEQ